MSTIREFKWFWRLSCENIQNRSDSTFDYISLNTVSNFKRETEMIGFLSELGLFGLLGVGGVSVAVGCLKSIHKQSWPSVDEIIM